MSVVIPTLSGASFMAAAGPNGPYAPIRYFLPYYDHRVDPFVHADAGTSALTAADLNSATSVIGEVIYNVSALNAATPGSYVYSVYSSELLPYDSGATTSGAGTSRLVIGSGFDSTALVNRLNGTPLSHVISGSSITHSGPVNWLVENYTVISGSNGNPYSPSTNRNRFFRVSSYGPITSAAGGNARGTFKIRLARDIGNFKFNKIALYAAKFLADGTEDTGVEPVLFAVAVLKNPVLKTTDSTNMNNFELDLEIEFYSQGAASQISYLGDDYWNRYNEQLWYSGNIAVASLSAVPGSWETNARLNLTVGDNEDIPHIRLTSDNINFFTDISYYKTNETTDALLFQSNCNASTWTIATSGNASTYGYIQIAQDGPAEDGTSSSTVSFTSVHPLSGSMASGLVVRASSGGLSTVDLYVNSVTVIKWSEDNGSNSRVVMGYEADSQFYHESAYLNVHGGLYVDGPTILDNSISLSANGYAFFANLVTSESVFATGNLVTTAGIIADDPTAINLLGKSQFTLSADFFTDVKVFGDITSDANVLGVNMAASALVSAPSVWATNSALVGLGMALQGPGGLITAQNLGVSTSANFEGPVTMRTSLLAHTVSAGALSASYGFYERSRPVAIGDWISAPPTMTVNTGAITATPSNAMQYTLIGSSMFINFFFEIRVTGSPAAIYLTIPSNYAIPGGPNTFFYGGWGKLSNGAIVSGIRVFAEPGSDLISIFRDGNGVAFPNSSSIWVEGGIIIPVS